MPKSSSSHRERTVMALKDGCDNGKITTTKAKCGKDAKKVDSCDKVKTNDALKVDQSTNRAQKCIASKV